MTILDTIKSIGNAVGYVIAALGICAVVLLIAIQAFTIADKLREGCTSERASETMNLVTCKSGSHYETR